MNEYLKSLEQDMKSWRHHLHAHPEIAFKEHKTSAYIEKQLRSFGCDSVEPGWAETGIVALVKGNKPGPMLGFRADMDALPLEEENLISYKSTHDGMMHACGHDGHSTMLLGAVKYLADHRDFAGTICFIFQPAEENEGGAKVMVEQDLFEKYPCDEVYGLHNWPGIPAGTMAMGQGPMMAAFDVFDIEIEGVGCHAAKPHTGKDTLVMASNVILALQSLVSRRIDPLHPAVVSVTSMHVGTTYNILPEKVHLKGTVRCFDAQVQEQLKISLHEVVDGVVSALGGNAKIVYKHCYPMVINTKKEQEKSMQAALSIVGKEQIISHPEPSMGSEDFAFMLNEKPGCYAWIGNGLNGSDLHNPTYDFNDDILIIGAQYWIALAQH